ncbi:hypothetical protein KY285_010279 [Solanum tuberosum]|nr:hypothetical protein KY289_010820 [Solanum tuberosum]KAH0734572.1 hypothetical protein KY285_010279 [Solanum tuberosum]
MEFHRRRRREDHLAEAPAAIHQRPTKPSRSSNSNQASPLSSPTLLLQQPPPLYSPAKKSTTPATTIISGQQLRSTTIDNKIMVSFFLLVCECSCLNFFPF